jgi:hypothetical protein
MKWVDKKLQTKIRFFQSWNSPTKTAMKSWIANRWKKYPNDRLLVQNLHTTKRGGNCKAARLGLTTDLNSIAPLT